MPAQSKDIDEVYLVRAGKFRRYHGEKLKQLLDIPTVVKNIRDAVWTAIGLWQSFRLLKRLKPEVIFIKGGFVGVPVGLSAALLHIPYITHDSDALPGLANRIIAPWAKIHAVALPKELYSRYPADKTITVGVPLNSQYHPLTKKDVNEARERIGVPQDGKVLFITGGSLGAQRINEAIASCAAELLDRYPELTILQIAGRTHEAAIRQQYKRELTPQQASRIVVKGFVSDLYLYSAAADIVITRAGATTIAELAAQHKTCIVVPNPLLTGGHQLVNAEAFAARKAVRLVDEETLRHDDHALMPAIVDLFDHPEKAKQFGDRLGEFVQPDAAEHLAMLILDVANHHAS